jgi:hypothetical protein
MPVTQADIDALNGAIASGVRSVTMPGGHTVTYNTTDSLIRARDDMRKELANQQAVAVGGVPRQYQLFYDSRGYH